jgi:hypothetical protein
MEIIVSNVRRNQTYEFFPSPERTYSRGEAFGVYAYTVGVNPVDIENALGSLDLCIRTTALPLQNPCYLLIARYIPRYGGLFQGGELPLTGFGALGVIFTPSDSIEGASVVLGVS